MSFFVGNSDYFVYLAVPVSPGPSIDLPISLLINNDDIVECNETFMLRLVSHDTVHLQIDPAHDQANVTIIDNDGLYF